MSCCWTHSSVGAGTHPGADIQACSWLHGWIRHPRCSQAATLPNSHFLSLFRSKPGWAEQSSGVQEQNCTGLSPSLRLTWVTFPGAAPRAPSLLSFGWSTQYIQAIMYRGNPGTSFYLRLVSPDVSRLDRVRNQKVCPKPRWEAPTPEHSSLAGWDHNHVQAWKSWYWATPWHF